METDPIYNEKLYLAHDQLDLQKKKEEEKREQRAAEKKQESKSRKNRACTDMMLLNMSTATTVEKYLWTYMQRLYVKVRNFFLTESVGIASNGQIQMLGKHNTRAPPPHLPPSAPRFLPSVRIQPLDAMPTLFFSFFHVAPK